ncbi:interleukin-31 receptor subunit alpha-like isoform X2 [Salminus brasiliensis]|uniref:interleukin-31 receptor subunit alpha-like isoform X2 n=1 Tax=Salminus brasiliensis TaxID=930266 RepID=UPI003B8388AB
MQTSLFIMVVALHAVCKGQEICVVFPKNQLVKYGSDVVVLFRAPFNSDCHKKTGFDPSRVSWKLNNQMIAKDYYNMTDSSTFSVSIPNFSLTTGTVEFLMDDNVLSGTLIRTYTVPQNISCIGSINEHHLICTWDHDQYTTDTSYIVILKQNDRNHTYTSKEKSFKIENTKLIYDKNISITVIAKTPAVEAPSEEVTYANFFETVRLDPPKNITVEAELNGLRVTWKNELIFSTSCQVRSLAEGSEPVVKDVPYTSESTVKLTEMKECTNYSISVRCKIFIWGEWSQNVIRLTHLNVSNVKFHLWRSRSVTIDKGNRKVHLMWKGVPPSCKAFDEYRLIDQTYNSTMLSFDPSRNHTFIDLDENMHRISVAAFRNNKWLGEASIEIPSIAEDFNLPPVTNVQMFAGGGQIYITWDKPNLTVSGYIIVWNTTERNHMWQQTEKTHFSLKGKNFTLYTISLMPLYENSPGSEIKLHSYAQEKDLAKVSNIKAEKISSRKAEIRWRPILLTECCALVVSYTVFYKTQKEAAFRNVSVDRNQHSVILNDLKPSTLYEVCVQANAAAASSKMNCYRFSTKPFGKDYFIGLIVCGVGLTLLLVLAVLFTVLRKEYLSEKFPDPRFSSLSLWSSQKCKNPWTQLPMHWGCESEKILICQVEAEDRDVGKLKASTGHNFTIQETMTTTPEKESTALVRPNQMELVSHGKEERRQPLLAVDLQTSQIHPVHTHSPYRNQTPATSPVDSPTRVFQGIAKPRSSETETLLKPKPHNTALLATYVTVDMFVQGKGPKKQGVQ